MTFNSGKRKLKTPSAIEGACIMRPLLLPNNRDWLGAFSGVLLQLTKPYNWQQLSETDLTPEQAAAQAQSIIDEYFNQQGECDMNCCEPPLTRVTDDFVVQTSTDGGETWTDTPSADPRNTSILFAPLGGADGDEKRCKAAENVVAMLTDNVAEFVANLGVITGIAAFIVAVGGIIAVVLSAGALTAAVATLALALWGLGASTLAAAFTSEVWEFLRCALYCEFDETGRITSGGIAIVISKVQEEFFGDIPADIIPLLLNNYGVIGINNLATLQSEGDGDSCGECDCLGEWCWFADFEGAQAQGFENYDGTGTGTGFLGGSGWTAGVDTPNSTKYVHARRSFETTTINKITLNYTLTPDDCGDGANNVQCRVFLEGVQQWVQGHGVSSPETDASWEFDLGGVVCDEVDIGLECGCFEPYGSGSIHSAQFEGVGEPIEEPNCDE